MSFGTNIRRRLAELGWEPQRLVRALEERGFKRGTQQRISVLFQRDSNRVDLNFALAVSHCLQVGLEELIRGQWGANTGDGELPSPLSPTQWRRLGEFVDALPSVIHVTSKGYTGPDRRVQSSVASSKGKRQTAFRLISEVEARRLRRRQK